MNYYQIINCKKEPFPGLAMPELFFAAAPHEECLVNLKETVFANRHSFHAVIGETGAGKTTIFYQFQKRLLEDTSKIDVELASHKWFSSKKVFLSQLSKALEVAHEENSNEQVLLKEIKNFLAAPPREDKKKLVILFDQAEKIPSYCLEIFEDIFSKKISHANVQFVLFATPILIKKIRQHRLRKRKEVEYLIDYCCSQPP